MRFSPIISAIVAFGTATVGCQRGSSSSDTDARSVTGFPTPTAKSFVIGEQNVNQEVQGASRPAIAWTALTGAKEYKVSLTLNSDCTQEVLSFKVPDARRN